jgi:hypothetical protein
MIRIRFFAVGFAVLLAFAGGCTSMRRSYPGRTADEVWTAMKAVASEPNYHSEDYHKRWIVRENNVWADEQNRRIEVFRSTTRAMYQPGADPQVQNREWRFQMVLQSTDPPEVKFVSRGFSAPSWAYTEAERFFDDLGSMLAGAPTATTAPASPMTPPEPIEAIDPPVDVEPPQTQPRPAVDIEPVPPPR